MPPPITQDVLVWLDDINRWKPFIAREPFGVSLDVDGITIAFKIEQADFSYTVTWLELDGAAMNPFDGMKLAVISAVRDAFEAKLTGL